jgi:type IV secretory pathway TraG/TraD family ATPase VirD4
MLPREGITQGKRTINTYEKGQDSKGATQERAQEEADLALSADIRSLGQETRVVFYQA